MSEIETKRLIIRHFTPVDWKGVQTLAIDKETHKRDPHDPPWPTSDDECKEFADEGIGFISFLTYTVHYSAIVIILTVADDCSFIKEKSQEFLVPGLGVL